MPFIQTALIGDDEENILHFTGYKIRTVGNGSLAATLISLDEVRTQSLAVVNQAAANLKGIEPMRLANFISQRAMLKLEVRTIDVVFNISRILIYIKPIYSDYPSSYGQ